MGPDHIEVRAYGATGPLVVLLHGGPGAGGEVAPLARDLAVGFQVLESLQRRSGGAPLTVAGHVADLAAVAPEQAAVVGWSWGAMLALSYASRHPGRVRSLALIGCGTYDPAGRAAYQAVVTDRLGEEGRRRAADLQRRLEVADPAEADRLQGDLGRLMGAAQGHDPLPDQAPPSRVDARGHAETWADALRLQAEGVEPAAFAAIGCPALMLHGDDDPHPGPATFDLLRRFLPQLRYRGFERCGHQPWAERHAREPFLVALHQWLEETAP